jgi:hypothetical protein
VQRVQRPEYWPACRCQIACMMDITEGISRAACDGVTQACAQGAATKTLADMPMHIACKIGMSRGASWQCAMAEQKSVKSTS